MKSHNFFMKTAFILAQESKCVSYQVGSIIVKNDRIISMGYNGTPPKTTNCCDHFNKDNFDRQKHREWSNQHEIHSEMNSIAFAAKHGVEVDGCDIYVTLSPCNNCLKNIVMCGIKNVYYYELYDHSDLTQVMLEQINVEQLQSTELDNFIKSINQK